MIHVRFISSTPDVKRSPTRLDQYFEKERIYLFYKKLYLKKVD